jgi:nicotinate-nucleotide adenylyltransferase
LRQRLADGDPCRDLIPPPVADYILHRGLYRRSTSDGQTWPS